MEEEEGRVRSSMTLMRSGVSCGGGGDGIGGGGGGGTPFGHDGAIGAVAAVGKDGEGFRKGPSFSFSRVDTAEEEDGALDGVSLASRPATPKDEHD